MGHRLVVVLLGAALSALAPALVACGSDSSNDSGSPSPSTTSSAASSQVCSALSALSDDVKTMTTAGSLSQFQDGLESAKNDFARLEPAASSAYGPEVDAVQQALDNFGEQLQSAGQGDAGAGLQRIGTAAVELGTAVQKLATDLPCPSAGSG